MEYHVPVMLDECTKALNVRAGMIYVDATAGGGSHSEAILKANTAACLISFDQDMDAINFASKKLEKYKDRHQFIQANFSELRTQLALLKIKTIDGILFDLGVSSYQIDESARGFSFAQDAELDMRMDQSQGISAKDVVNEMPRTDLTEIFFRYGEEKEARRIAAKIDEQRQIKEICTTHELANIIEVATHSYKKTKAKARIFQALRIYVNDEMAVLKTALKDAVNILNPGGRIVVLVYHSLEAKIVKQFFKEEALDCTCPTRFPTCICNKVSRLEIINKKAIFPSVQEIKNNSRARSASMRVAQKKEVV